MSQPMNSIKQLCVIALLIGGSIAVAEKPNIILIMADDQGYGDAGYTGHPEIVTPHLDAMAKQSLRFDRFYAAAPVCTPTRGSVMTGRHPNRFECFQWGHDLRPQEVTIAEALKKAGYTTGHFGKWHLGSVRVGDPTNPGNNGFDQWLSAPNFYDNDPILSRNGKAVQLEGESSIIAADAAIDFIDDYGRGNPIDGAQGKPFFAVVWFGSPHSPHRAVEQDKAHYDKNAKRRDWMGEITGLDRAVGKIRTALRARNIEKDTLVWYCSDNGGLVHASAGGRAKKGSIYEGGLRVPALIEWPGKLEHRVITQPAVTSDIYPTLVELTGAAIDDQPKLDGVSLMPILRGAERVQRGPIGFWDYDVRGISTPSAKLMAELLEAQKAGDIDGDDKYVRTDAAKITKQYPKDSHIGHSAWLDWPWKLHRIENRKNGKVRYELYNLEQNPMEKDSVIDNHPDRAASMRKALDTWLDDVTDSLNGADYAS